MEFLREKWFKVKKDLTKLVGNFNFPNGREFDDDFRQILNIFRLTGFYRSDSSKSSFAMKYFMFIFVVLTFTSGLLKDLILVLHEGKVHEALMHAVVLSIEFTFSAIVFNFIKNQSDILDLVKALQKLHDPSDEPEMEVYRKTILKMLKLYKIGMVGHVFLIGLGLYKLVAHAIYDVLAEGKLYGLFLFINAIHTCIFLALFIPCEFLHILCMKRIEGNLKFLGSKLRNCTDDENPEVALARCIKYHCEILE